MNLKKEKRSIFESLPKIVFNTSIALMLFFVFSVGDAHATTPTVTSAKITGANQITVVYNTAVNSTSTDYTDFQGDLSSCTSDSVSGSSTDTILITLGTCSLAINATGTMDIGVGITSVDSGDNLIGINDRYVADGQAPTFTAERIDVNTIDLTFLEDFGVSGNEPSAWIVSDGATVTSAINTTGRILEITTTGLIGTDETPTVTYVAANGSAVDGSGNEVVDGTNVIASDGVAPRIDDFLYLDTDDDGKIDTIDVDFSEDVVAASVIDANDLTFTNVGDFAGAAFGASAGDLISGTVSDVYITLGTEATVADTEENTGNIAISSQNAFSLVDAAGNTNSALGVQIQAMFIDAASPVLGASDIVVDNSVQPNTVTLTFTEDLDQPLAETAGNWVVTNNSAAISYGIHDATLSSSNVVVLTLNDVLAASDETTYITNADIDSHIKVIPNASIEDTNSNQYVAGLVTESGSAHTKDSTSGTVNAVLAQNSATTFTVTFSEQVDETTAETVTNYPLSGTCSASTGDATNAILQANGVDVLLTVPDTSGCNAGGLTVIVTPSASITDVAGVPITSSAAEITLADTLAPTFTAERTDINTFVLTFSENVDADAANEISAWSVTGATSISAVTDPANTDTLTITTTGFLIDNTSATPVVTYHATPGTVVDGAGNEVADGAQATASDGVAPMINRFLYEDYDHDGRIEYINVRFSEPVVANSVISPNDLTFTNVGDFTGAAFGTSAGDLITGTVSEMDVALGTEATAIDTEENSGNIAISSQHAFSLEDAAGNVNSASAPQNQATFVDGASPIFTAERTGVNTIALTFTEAVTASNNATTSWTLSSGSVSSATQPSATSTLTITTAGITGTDETPLVTYNAGFETIRDVANNQLGGATQAIASDGVAPIINAFIYYDNDQNGMIDMINVHFSENVVVSSVISANDLIFTDVGDFTGAEFGNDATDLITATGNNVDITLGTEATVVDTGENSGNIAISSQHAFSLEDAAGNVNSALASQGQATFYDYVYPIFTAERTDVNTIVLTFSEPISANDASTSAWTLDQGSVSSVTQPSNETTLTITTTGIIGSDETPVVTYVDAHGTVTDEASNEVDDGTQATASDGIAPTAALSYSDSDKVFESGQNVTITATFNEPMANSPVVKLALDNSELSATAMTKASTTVYTYNYTVQSSTNISTVTASLSVGEDGAGNVITATPTSGATFEISNPSSGGGGGGGTSYCSSVEFDVWQETCVNGLQYRNILSKSPSNCTFTSSQQADRSRACGEEVEVDKEEPEEAKKEVEVKKENTDYLLDGVLPAFINSEKALLKAIDKNLAKRLSGKILLQVEGHGEAWYVNPTNQNRYFLGRPADAFGIMRQLGLGVSEADFSSFGEYAPARLAGRILLRVENHGEAYYVSPVDNKMYYLGRPADAFNVMRNLGLGITNDNIRKININ